MKITFPTLIDTVFTTFIFFFVSFLILNYYIERQFAITFSIILSVPVLIIVFAKLREKSNRRLCKRKLSKAVEKTCNALDFYTTAQKNDLFIKALSRAGYNTERKHGGIFIKDKNCAIFILYGFKSVDKTDVVKIFNHIKSTETAYIFAKNFSTDITAFIARFKGRIIAIDGNKTHEFLKKYDCLPKENSLIESISEQKFSLSFLDAKKSKRFLGLGILFLLTSYFVPIKLYYVIFGCLFLVLSLVIKLFGKNEKTV